VKTVYKEKYEMDYAVRDSAIAGAGIEISPEMIDAGVAEILGEVGGADFGGFFCAPDLASRVYRAMKIAQDCTMPYRGACKNL
jgi:hypothetical protein